MSVPGDNDGDTVPDPIGTDVLSIGTDHFESRADTPTADDEAAVKWPPDSNDNQIVNIGDIIKVLPPIFCTGCL